MSCATKDFLFNVMPQSQLRGMSVSYTTSFLAHFVNVLASSPAKSKFHCEVHSLFWPRNLTDKLKMTWKQLGSLLVKYINTKWRVINIAQNSVVSRDRSIFHNSVSLVWVKSICYSWQGSYGSLERLMCVIGWIRSLLVTENTFNFSSGFQG